MGRTLDLVGHGHGKALKRDPALAGRIDQKLVRSEAELAGPAAGFEQRLWRQEAPVQFLFLTQPLQEGRAFSAS
jgi:hypothetical protein